MIILKLGGSVITDKSVPFSVHQDVLTRLASEIKEAGVEVVIVHGGGSFGHPVASKYELQNGLKGPEQLMGVAETRLAMNDLNRRVVEIFVELGLPAISIQSSAIFTCRNKRVETAQLDVVGDFLRLGTIPVLYGDVVVDSELGVCILSGDQIVSRLASGLGAEQVVLATNVEGVLNSSGGVIERITPHNSAEVLGMIGGVKGDVTGGMKGKVSELIELSETGVSALVVNALVAGRVKNALLGKAVKGTLFEAQK